MLLIFVVSTNYGIAGRLEEIGLQAGLAVFALLWLIIAVSLFAIAFHPRLPLRLGWGSVVIVSAFAGDVFYNVTNSYLSVDDLNTLYDSRGDVAQAYAYYRPYFLEALAKSLVGMLAIWLPPPSRFLVSYRRGLGLAAHSIVIPIVAIAAILYVRGGQGSNGLPSQVTPLALSAFSAAYAALEPAPRPREPVSIPLSGKPLARHVVLIVDESIRGDILDINSPDGVVTHLLEHPDQVVNYGYASALSNCSDTTGLGLRFGASRDTEVVKYAPAIWSYARQAGYRSVYLDAQKSGGDLHNMMTPQEKGLIDEFIQLEGVDTSERDQAAARQLNKILSRTEPQFVYVYKNGAHFPYEGKYPLARAHYLPHMSPDDVPGMDREKLVNSYRNATEWNVAGFFQEFFAHAPLDRTIAIYTSDHGQHLNDIGSGDKTRTHCTPEHPSPEEGLVSLVVISGQPSLLARFRATRLVNQDKATHFNIFPTLLVAMGYNPDAVRQRYEPSLMEQVTTPQLFISGDLFRKYGRDLHWNRTLTHQPDGTDAAHHRAPPATSSDKVVAPGR